MRRKVWMLLAATALWAAGGAAALAGGWARVEVLNREALAGPLPAGEHELQIQVLQHGHFPVEGDRVMVVATQGDRRVEQVAESRFLDPGHHHEGDAADGHQHQPGADWPAGQEPGYVARLNLPEPGLWQVTVTSAWPPVEGANPIQFELDIRPAAPAASAATGPAAVPAASPATGAAAVQSTGGAALQAAGRAAPRPDWRLAAAGGAVLAGVGLLLLRQRARRNRGSAPISS